ncbi:hypothetical protein [Streptomyces sp. NPDC006477]|uniref:hypothetical protein n=1 Tax=Streptomyces sp. NPDC006477 TaxID=3364747 RepID=UPI0036AA15A8
MVDDAREAQTGVQRLQSPESELHARQAHPDWEYATTEGPRKHWDDANTPPYGDDGEPDATWQPNTDRGRDGWERFDYTEESYWRRPKPRSAPEAAVVRGTPAEHCGDQFTSLIGSRVTECVLRPGRQGSHADDAGARWWKTGIANLFPASESATSQDPAADAETPLQAARASIDLRDAVIAQLKLRSEIAEAKARELDGAADIAVRAIQLMNAAGAERDAARATVERVQDAVHIADDADVTDWQRGYRACADRVLAALKPPA